MQTYPFQFALDEHMQALDCSSRICPIEQDGIREHDPRNIRWPGAQAHAFIWLFQTNPFWQLTQELPFQFEFAGQAQLLTLLSQACPFGQLIHATPFHCVLIGHWQCKVYWFQTNPFEQVIQIKPFQLDPLGQAHWFDEALHTCPFGQAMQLVPFQFNPLGHKQFPLLWSQILPLLQRLVHCFPFQIYPTWQNTQVLPLK